MKFLRRFEEETINFGRTFNIDSRGSGVVEFKFSFLHIRGFRVFFWRI